MVSKANDDLPEPDSPVMTVRLLRGISTSTFLRLCTRAPHTFIFSSCIFVVLLLLLLGGVPLYKRP